MGFFSFTTFIFAHVVGLVLFLPLFLGLRSLKTSIFLKGFLKAERKACSSGEHLSEMVLEGPGYCLCCSSSLQKSLMDSWFL